MPNLLKLSKLFIFSFVIFTFLISVFTSKYYDHYEKSDLATYNHEIISHRTEGENICAELKEPLWGMATYYHLSPLAFAMIEISALFLFLTFIISFIKKGILSEKRDKIIFVCLVVIILWSSLMLVGSHMGIIFPYFYNYAKIC